MLSPIRRILVKQVRSTFNDASKGERPVPSSDHALFSKGAVIRKVHGDVTSMMVGGVAALLTQMLHPKALAGVWDHSDVEEDQLGRLRRTARFIAATTFGDRDRALGAIAKVRAIHEQVKGALPDGSPYSASDPWLLAWVHVAGAINFLNGWRRYGDPAMSGTEQDRYFAESGEIAKYLGADPVPQTRGEVEVLLAEFQSELTSDSRSREFRDLVLRTRARSLVEAPVQKLLMTASIDLLPPFALALHGLSRPALPSIVRNATYGVATTLRWAFAGEHYRKSP